MSEGYCPKCGEPYLSSSGTHTCVTYSYTMPKNTVIKSTEELLSDILTELRSMNRLLNSMEYHLRTLK